jgi:hypothetical protein
MARLFKNRAQETGFASAPQEHALGVGRSPPKRLYTPTTQGVEKLNRRSIPQTIGKGSPVQFGGLVAGAEDGVHGHVLDPLGI